MNKIIKYHIVSGGSVGDIEGNVNRLLRSGWEPVGGVTINGWEEYLQTMVLRGGVLNAFQLLRAKRAVIREEVEAA
jgi:hypothetical protein